MNEMNPRPQVSVILPLFEIGALVDEAVSDLRNQTHTGWEAVFVDDCSGDDAAARERRLVRRDLARPIAPANRLPEVRAGRLQSRVRGKAQLHHRGQALGFGANRWPN